ncbi:peptidoglycan recognition protein family protein [Brevibacillus massiliensis]|uniref:peptidoglycan recognition protein family protein n=1 Tax=Brevibacillus massiliensis TaxID=1118054 RepID=UPI0002FDEFD6|nr:N-acetylmuramoyl-L-alanine amidase [Brevibacillus massiliensis]
MLPIIQDFIPVGRPNRPGKKWTAPKYITIHDTGNKGAGANARSHAAYVKSDEAARRMVSWHFTVDETTIVQHLPLDEAGWHAGDGSGPGNSASIGIEICENADGDRAKAEANAAELTAYLLEHFNLSIDCVVQHNRWSGKNCPHIIRGRVGGWESFLTMVESKRNPATEPLDKQATQKVISVLSALYMASGDKGVQAAAHHAANSLRRAVGIDVID